MQTMLTLFNVLLVVCSCLLLHGLAKGLSALILKHLPAPLPPDRPLLYFLLIFLLLTGDFFVLQAIALLTGIPVLHILSFFLCLLVVWGLLAFSLQDFLNPKDIVGLNKVFIQVPQYIKGGLPDEKWERACIYVVFAIWSVYFIEGITRPPDGWDGLVYHLPLAMKWMQNGNLHFIPESWKFDMPGNGELVFLFLMYLGEDRMISVAYLPIHLFGVLLVYAMALRIGADVWASRLAAVGFGTLPIILSNAFSTYIDLFGAIFFILSLYYALWWMQTTGLSTKLAVKIFLALIGLSFGMALGTKYIYVPFLALILVLVFGISLKMTAPPVWNVQGMFVSSVRVGLVTFWGLLPSLYWYVRNYHAVGYPFYPLQFVLDQGKLKIKRAMMVEKWEWLPKNKADLLCSYDLTSFKKLDLFNLWEFLKTFWIDCHYSGDHFGPNSGLGPVFTAFVLVSFTAVIGVLLWKLFQRHELLPVLFPIILTTLFFLFWWVFLFHALRFLFPMFALMFVIFAYGLGLIKGYPRQVAIILLFGAFFLNGVLVSARPIQKLASRIHHNEWARSDYYNIPQVIDSLPAGSVVLNAGHELKNYPLYGKRLENRVVTNRVLIEPQQLRQISQQLLDEWKVEYIYFESNSNVIFEDKIQLTVVHQKPIENAYGKYQQILYKVN